MQKQRFLTTGLVILALSGLAGFAHAGQYPQDHNGFSIGFGVGGGSAAVSDDSGNSTDRTSGALGSFRLGYPLTPKLSLALESNAWSKSENNVTVTFSATTFGVACFPSEGLTLRGGLGFGRTTLSASSGNASITATESGLGLNGSVGYEFRLARTFALGPQIEGGYASFKGGSSNWVGGALAFNWYLLAKK